MKYSVLPAMLVLIAASAHAAAPSDKYILETSHTKMLFSVSHLGFSNFYGEFTRFDGGFHFNAKYPERSTIDVTVHPASIRTGSDMLDGELTSQGMFDAARYRDVHFKSTSIKVLGKNKGAVTGDLSIKDIHKPVTLNVIYNKCGTHPITQAFVCGFTADGEIKRSDFGLSEWEGMVGDTVKLHFEVEGVSENSQKKMKRT